MKRNLKRKAIVIGFLLPVAFLSYCGWKLFLGFYEGELSERTWKMATMTSSDRDLEIFRTHRTMVKLYSTDSEERVHFEYLIPAKELNGLAEEWDRIAARNGLSFMGFHGEKENLTSTYEDQGKKSVSVSLARRGSDVRMTIDKPRTLFLDKE